MIKSDARTTALRKTLAAFQAAVLMFVLVASSFPSPVIAQEVTETPSVEEVTETEIVETPDVPTEEEPKEEESLLEQVLGAFVDLTVNNTPKTITVTKVLGAGVTESCSDFSFSIEKANNVILTQAFEPDCTNIVTDLANGSHIVYETAATAAGYVVTYSDNVNANNKPGCHLEVSNGNPTRTCTITNNLVPVIDVDEPTGTLVVEKTVIGGTSAPTDFSFVVKDNEGNVVVPAQPFLLNDGPEDWQGPNRGRNVLLLPYGTYSIEEVAAPGYTTEYIENDWPTPNPDGWQTEDCDITITGEGNQVCDIKNTYVPPQLTQCSFVSDTENNYVEGGTVGSVAAHPAWTTALSGDGAAWIWATPDATGVQTFTRTINVAGLSGSAQLQIASDNGYSVEVNGSGVGITCDGSGTGNFGALETCTIPVVNGTNTLEFTATNFGGPANAGEGNPAGLYYKVSLEATSCSDVPPVQYSEVTMCKVNEAGAPLSGWTLTLKGDNVQNGLAVPSTNSAGVNSNPLVAGVSYIATALGTWSNQGGANLVDAEYSTTDIWGTHMDGYTGYQNDILELQINSAFDPNSNWGAYNSAHTYAQAFVPSVNGAANFRIFDGTGTTQNEGWFFDNAGNLTLNLDEGYAGVTGENGCTTFSDVPYGIYTAGEIMQDGFDYVQTLDGETPLQGTSVTVDSEEETFTVVNEAASEEEETATVYATKIVCEDEADLPNWGDGDADIDATTASDFLATHETCHEVAWNFEWRTGTNSGDPYNPGDNVNLAGDPWTPFVETAEIPAGSFVWVREQTSDDYIPFTGAGAESDVSAEIYCSNDVLNYDNFDFISPVAADGEYYCVAFNVPAEESEDGACTIVSDETTIEGEAESSLVSSIHSAWTAFIASASWIWGEDPTADPVAGDVQTFTKTFTLDSVVEGATLEIAADNGYTVSVNGNPVAADAGEFNYSAAGQDTIVVPVNLFVVGENTLTIEVTNLPQAGGTAASNPGGLLYKLSIDGANCDDDGGEEEDDSATLTIVKNTVGGDGTFSFSVAPILLIDEVGPTVSAATSTDVTTTTGTGSTTLELEAGTYSINELAEEDWNLDGATCTHDNQLAIVDVEGGTQFTIANEDDDVTCTFTNFFDGDGDGDPTTGEFLYTITEGDLVTFADFIGDPSLVTDPESWFFYNDESDVIDNALGSFVSGPGTAPLNDGSVQMSVSGTQRHNIATYQFKDVKLADIDALSFSTYAQSVGDGSPGTERAPYLHFNVDFDNSDTWQRRLVFVPAANGVVTADTWQTWDAINSGNALWVYSGATWPTTSQAEVGVPGTTAKTWNEILVDYPAAETRSTDSWFGFRVGEPYADGFTGNVDNFVIEINDGSTDITSTYDFEPVTEEITITDTDGGGGGGGGSNKKKGSVLGATTDAIGDVLGATCEALLTTFMRMGQQNDTTEVTELQTFLNTEMGSGLPVTGIFGTLTDAAVRAFQLKYAADVLIPWISVPGSGINDADDTTGYVYKTTQWKINMINCPSLNLPAPMLP